jgi:DNA-binding transcriptional LysR family regulator
MNLNHLALFHAVAREGSVSGGARAVYVSQSAVSKQLGEFERALGVPLFDRLPRGVRLTEAGHLLQGYASRLFALEAEAEQALAELQRLARGRLRLGASRTIGGYLLPEVLAAFRAAHAGVEVALHVDNSQVIEQRLLAGELDIGFAEGVAGVDGLDYRVFADDELVLIAAPDHPLLAHAPIAPAGLRDLPLLMHEPGSGTRAVTERALAARDLHLRPVMTLASTEAIKRTVAAGSAVAFLSAYAIRSEVRAGFLQVLPVAGLTISRPLYQVTLASAWRSPAAQQFLDLLTPPAA